ncbi:MAG: hypothetical protein ABIF17_04075, partial [Patescibacteria group bacterium]
KEFVFSDKNGKRYKFSPKKIAKLDRKYKIGELLNEEEIIQEKNKSLVLEYLNDLNAKTINAKTILTDLPIDEQSVDDILDKLEKEGVVGEKDNKGNRKIKIDLGQAGEFKNLADISKEEEQAYFDEINKKREEMLKDLENRGRLQEIYNKAKDEYLANKNDLNAKGRYEHAAAEFAAANVNERLNEILKDQAVAEAKLDTRGKRFFSKLEKKWQSFEGINIYDKYLNNKAKDKLYGKVLFHNAVSRFILKKGLSLKTGISFGLAGVGFLSGLGALGLAGAGGMAIGARRSFGGMMAGVTILAGTEKVIAKKGRKSIEEIKKDFNEQSGKDFFNAEPKEQDKIIAEYEYSAAVNSVDLNKDEVYQKMIKFRFESIRNFTEALAEKRLVDIKEYIFKDIEQKNKVLDAKFANIAWKRAGRTFFAGVMGAATAVLIPKALVAARHSEDVREIVQSIGITKWSFLDRFFVGDAEYRNIIKGLGIKPSDGIDINEYAKIKGVIDNPMYSDEIRGQAKSVLGKLGLTHEQIAEFDKELAVPAETAPDTSVATPDVNFSDPQQLESTFRADLSKPITMFEYARVRDAANLPHTNSIGNDAKKVLEYWKSSGKLTHEQIAEFDKELIIDKSEDITASTGAGTTTADSVKISANPAEDLTSKPPAYEPKPKTVTPDTFADAGKTTEPISKSGGQDVFDNR